MRTILDRLIRKPVEVRANGFIYRGTLIEVTEQELTVRGPAGFFSIPMDRITSVHDPNEHAKKQAGTFVDPSFYSADVTTPKATTEAKKEEEKKS